MHKTVQPYFKIAFKILNCIFHFNNASEAVVLLKKITSCRKIRIPDFSLGEISHFTLKAQSFTLTTEEKGENINKTVVVFFHHGSASYAEGHVLMSTLHIF